MYCENCGNKVNLQDNFCEECGTKINREISNTLSNNNSNKKIWIILGCVFGGMILLILTMFILYSFIVVSNVKTVEEKDPYNIEEYYDYEKLSNYFYNDKDVEVIKIK